MQLLALALYSHDGRLRPVRFEPGKLNIVTGESKTGKSALLTITEYCLGRSEYLVPAGPIANTVSWYGSLWQLTPDPDGARAFAARPAPPAGQKETQRAMLAFGGAELDLIAHGDLVENTDTRTLRRQLGRRIGIEENVIESRGLGMSHDPFEANIGHAAWLCLQDQDEIASRRQIFHRQGDGKVAEHLKDTIPYFLGAVPADAASRRAALRDAQRALRRAEGSLATAEREAGEMDTMLQGLLAEAHAAGLTDVQGTTDRDRIILVLHAAAGSPVTPSSTQDTLTGSGSSHEPTASPRSPSSAPASPDSVGPRAPDGAEGPQRTPDQAPDQAAPDEAPAPFSEETQALFEAQNRRRALSANRDRLSRELDDVMDSRRLLLDRRDEERQFAEAVELHAGRLTSLDLLPKPRKHDEPTTGEGEEDAEHSCPVCGNDLEGPDPSVDQLRDRLTALRTQVTDLGTTPASIEAAVAKLEGAADRLRSDLSANEAALGAVVGAEEVARRERNIAAARFYTRGRISAMLSVASATSNTSLSKLRANVDTARARLERLADSFDPDAAREQLHSRLNIIGASMTDYARRLGVEHVENSVRLDLANLTVVTDTEQGPLPLPRIGSAANWIGYHLATHLALHRFLVMNDRPVPRFLMIDQPTQAFFPSDVAKSSGSVNDADRDAVLAMFILMRDVVEELKPRFQVIVSDHADLDEDWFQDAIVHIWRDGVKLVPADWL